MRTECLEYALEHDERGIQRHPSRTIQRANVEGPRFFASRRRLGGLCDQGRGEAGDDDEQATEEVVGGVIPGQLILPVVVVPDAEVVADIGQHYQARMPVGPVSWR